MSCAAIVLHNGLWRMHRRERSLSFHSRVCAALHCLISPRRRPFATDRPSRRGQPSISRWLFEPEGVKRRCMAGAAILGLRSKAGRRGPVAQWQQPSKRRRVSRPLIGCAKCRCAPQPGQSAARSRLAAGIQSLNPGPLSCAAGIRGAPPKLQSSSILVPTSYLYTGSMNACNSVNSSLGAHNCGIQQSNTCRHIAIPSNHKPPALAHPCPSCLHRGCTCLPACIR